RRGFDLDARVASARPEREEGAAGDAAVVPVLEVTLGLDGVPGIEPAPLDRRCDPVVHILALAVRLSRPSTTTGLVQAGEGIPIDRPAGGVAPLQTPWRSVPKDLRQQPSQLGLTLASNPTYVEVVRLMKTDRAILVVRPHIVAQY